MGGPAGSCACSISVPSKVATRVTEAWPRLHGSSLPGQALLTTLPLAAAARLPSWCPRACTGLQVGLGRAGHHLYRVCLQH